MTDSNNFELSDQYFDILKEIGNIGAGNATTALSQMLNTRVDMMVPRVKLMEFKEVGDYIGNEEELAAGIYLAVEGDITGSIMFMQRKKSARTMVSKLMGMELEGDDFSEIETSALKEIGNIITGAYLNSLSTLTNLLIYPSVPELCVDMIGAIISVPVTEFGVIGDKMLMIETDFSDDADMSGFFILMPDAESYNKILKSLGINI